MNLLHVVTRRFLVHPFVLAAVLVFLGRSAEAISCDTCSGHIDLGLGVSTPGVTLTVGYGSSQGSGSSAVRPNGKCQLTQGICYGVAPCEFYIRFTQIVIPGMDVPLISGIWNATTQQWDLVVVLAHFTSVDNNIHDEAGGSIDCGGSPHEADDLTWEFKPRRHAQLR